MSSVANILLSMRRRGIRLWVVDGELHCRAPKGALTPEQVSILRNLKHEIVFALAKEPSAGSTEDSARESSSNAAPLTMQQEGFWSFYQQNSQCGPIAFALRLRGKLNIDILSRSVDAMVERHEALRTRIVLMGGAPMQVIDEPSKYQLKFVNVAATATSSLEQEAAHFARDLLSRSVDLATGPLFEATLLRLGDCDNVLCVTVNHIVSDGLSMTLFFRELWRSYGDLLRDGRSNLAIPMQYSQYAVWQRNSPTREQHYWSKRLAGAVRARLPIDPGLEGVEACTTAPLATAFGAELTGALRDLAQLQHTTPSMVVLALYAAILSRWCDQRDFVIASSASGRSRAEHFNVLGCFSQIELLRIELTGSETFTELLKVVADEYYSANEHWDFGRATVAAPELCKGALFNWLPEEFWTAYEHPEIDGVRFSEPVGMPDLSAADGEYPLLSIEPFRIEWQQASDLKTAAEICMRFGYSVEGIVAHGYYRKDLFKADSMRRFAWDLRSIAWHMVRNPQERIKSFPAQSSG